MGGALVEEEKQGDEGEGEEEAEEITDDAHGEHALPAD